MRRFITEDGETFSSFLNCISERNYTVTDVNKTSILEFLTFGALYFDETFINGVTKQFTHQDLTLNIQSGFSKNLDAIKLRKEKIGQPIEQFLSYFSERINFLKSKKISIDLTGGIDSRLVAAILNSNNIEFAAAFSRSSTDEVEEDIVLNVADLLDIDLHILKPENTFNENLIHELFLLSDGHWDLLGLHSLRNTQKWRNESGYNLAITGIGGELYKDFWWQQDFPFYNQNKVNLAKLIMTRMYPVEIRPEWLTFGFKEVGRNLYDSFKNKLSGYSGNNTQAYDKIYFQIRIREQVSVFTNASSSYIDVWSPLLESELLQIGYNLPRSQRFFNRFHRNIITGLNSELAMIPTTEGGMTVSKDFRHVSRDIKKYILDKAAKIQRRKKTVPNSEIYNPDPCIIKKAYEAIEILKDVDIFSTKAPADPIELPKKLWGRLITIAMVIKSLK